MKNTQISNFDPNDLYGSVPPDMRDHLQAVMVGKFQHFFDLLSGKLNGTMQESEKASAVEKTQKNLLHVISHLAEANDTALGFYKLTNKQRDTLCQAKYEVTTSNDGGISSFAIILSHKDNRHEIKCHSLMTYMDDDVMAKTLCHELNHVIVAPFACNMRSIQLFASLALPLVGSILSGKMPWLMGGAMGYAASYYMKPLMYWPIRLEEKRADDFSDRVVPEITERDFTSNLLDIIQPTLQLGTWIENEMALQRFDHLFKQHPSEYTRNKLSDKNCPLYLEEKKRLGIPSLING